MPNTNEHVKMWYEWPKLGVKLVAYWPGSLMVWDAFIYFFFFRNLIAHNTVIVTCYDTVTTHRKKIYVISFVFMHIQRIIMHIFPVIEIMLNEKMISRMQYCHKHMDSYLFPQSSLTVPLHVQCILDIGFWKITLDVNVHFWVQNIPEHRHDSDC